MIEKGAKAIVEDVKKSKGNGLKRAGNGLKRSGEGLKRAGNGLVQAGVGEKLKEEMMNKYCK